MEPHLGDSEQYEHEASRRGFTPLVEPTDPPRPYLLAIIAIGAIALAVAAVCWGGTAFLETFME